MKKIALNSILALFLMALLALCTMGCASFSRSLAKDNYITTEVSDYVYHTNFSTVWAQAGALLLSCGYVVRATHNNTVLETEWGNIDSSRRRRYVVMGFVNSSGASQIHFEYYSDSQGTAPTTVPTRDYVMEYELIKQVEYERWKQIEDAANAYADAKAK